MERHIHDAYRSLMDLLDGLSAATLRALGIEALRAWRRKPPRPGHQPDVVVRQTPDVFSLNSDFGVELIRLLAKSKNAMNLNIPVMQLAFVNDNTVHTAWMGGVLEFLWWLERAGLAVAVGFGKKEIPTFRTTSISSAGTLL
jgi:hypothetical protein